MTEHKISAGCGCKLCQEPFNPPKYTAEEKALMARARSDYNKQVWALLKEQQARHT